MDSGISEIPEWVKEFDRNMLEVQFTENIGSYRKLIPALEAYPDSDIVVTADDDVIYCGDWLDRLVHASLENRKRVICFHANIGNYRKKYVHWGHSALSISGSNLLPIGAGGILYRREFFSDIVYDKSVYLRLAFCKDDLWFKYCTYLKSDGVLQLDNLNSFSVMHCCENLSDTNNRLFYSVKSKRIHFKSEFVARTLNWFGLMNTENDIAIKQLSEYFQFNPFKTSHPE